jgi:steroid 5-alpha reductase family enzyme
MLSAPGEPWATYVLAFTLLLGLFAVMWLLSVRTRDAGAIDIIWGPGFVLIAWVEWLRLQPRHLAALMVLTAVTAWGARLGLHLYQRHRLSEHEDARYAAMRAADPQRFWWRSLVTVFGLQAAILFALALPIHLAMSVGSSALPGGLTYLGLALFAGGFLLESAADRALLAFRRDPASRGKLLTSGVFAWSRHPNYFGECALWIGIGLMAWDASGQWMAMFGPLALIGLILTFRCWKRTCGARGPSLKPMSSGPALSFRGRRSEAETASIAAAVPCPVTVIR